MHVLEAGFEAAGRPLVLLLHGFPELAYSWRKVMPALAEPGFTSWRPTSAAMAARPGGTPYDGDLGSFRMLNVVRDAVGLVGARATRGRAGGRA